MRISDWSSDVCSSDLCLHAVARSRSARHRPQMTASAGPIGETEQQADVVTFLETPGALPPGETARRIDTHAAHIFLAGHRAWKLKPAVHYDSLDFSSPDQSPSPLDNRQTGQPTMW